MKWIKEMGYLFLAPLYLFPFQFGGSLQRLWVWQKELSFYDLGIQLFQTPKFCAYIIFTQWRMKVMMMMKHVRTEIILTAGSTWSSIPTPSFILSATAAATLQTSSPIFSHNSQIHHPTNFHGLIRISESAGNTIRSLQNSFRNCESHIRYGDLLSWEPWNPSSWWSSNPRTYEPCLCSLLQYPSSSAALKQPRFRQLPLS